MRRKLTEAEKIELLAVLRHYLDSDRMKNFEFTQTCIPILKSSSNSCYNEYEAGNTYLNIIIKLEHK